MTDRATWFFGAGRIWICGAVLGVLAAVAWAEPPRVFFDTASLVACRDVTTDGFRAANPHQRMLEAKITVSSLVERGAEDDLIEYFYRFECPEKSVRIVDYLPKTTLAPETAGNVAIENKDERTRSLGVTLSGKYDHLLVGGAAADAGRKTNNAVRYELLPPMRSVTASGTLQRESAVYFKLRATPQTSLEGAKQFVVVFRAPEGWRADYAHLHCAAFGTKRGVVRSLDEQMQCGGSDFLLALYAQGDAAAKSAAANLVEAESELRTRARVNQKQIQRRAFPTPVHKFAAMLDVADPRIPAGWLNRLVFSSIDSGAIGIAGRLPADVRTAALDFQKARVRLGRMSGEKDEAIAAVGNGTD